MGRLSWRWAAVAALVGVLVALPSAVRALPVSAPEVAAGRLRDLVRASGDVGWSGTSESRGALALPDVGELGELPALLGGTVRTRVWWRGPTSWRVDEQRLTGEQDVVVDGPLTTTWTSADRTVEQLYGLLPVRLPRAADLVAPVLGRRLAGASGTALSTLPGRRVAGTDAAGLRVVPLDPASSTVSSVDLWADPRTGLPLRVEVRARGQAEPVLTTLLLDLDRQVPPAGRTLFDVPRDATVTTDQAPDIAAQIDQAEPYVLPRRLAGADRQVVSGLERARGVGSYAAGLSSFVVVPLPRDIAARLRDRLTSVGGPRLSTPLVNALLGTAGRRAYLLVGTVPQAQLDAAFAELQRTPPPRTSR